MKRTLLAALLIICLALSSCSNVKAVEYCELGIVLTKDFEPCASDAFHSAYSNGDSFVGITRYSFADCVNNGLLTTYSPLKFAEVYLEMMDRTVLEGITEYNSVPYFIYTVTDSDGNELMYMPTFYRTPYAYFIITFITPAARYYEAKEEFLGYIKTAYIVEEHLS